MGDTITRHTISGPTRLRERLEVFAHAKSVLAALRDAGIIPRDKLPLDGSEHVLTIDGAFGASPAAFLVFYEAQPDLVWVELLHTQPAAQRKRMALQLLQALIKLAAETGMRKVAFGSLPDNEAMRRLAQCAGFLTDHVVYARAAANLGVGLA